MTITVAVRSTLAEQVLLTILDAQPVDVAEIRTALEQLQEPGLPEQSSAMSPCARLLAAATQVITTQDCWLTSLDDDTVDVDLGYDRFVESMAALKSMLAELAA